jgi:putative membrane protein
MVNSNSSQKNYRALIIGLSFIIPLAVAALFQVKIDVELPVFLPPIYATINGLTAIILVTAVWAIKNGKRSLHEKLMKSALILSALFLILYVLYHMTSESTSFGGEGFIKYMYYFILISHILLSVAVVPFVLFTFLHGINHDFFKHKRLARIAFPLWLYVAVTGVIVYIMISPYYV